MVGVPPVKRKLIRWFICRDVFLWNWNHTLWATRHAWDCVPGTEAPKLICRRCDYTIGF
jgi:hypothetical protein